MLYVDTPTRPEFKKLNRIRADACVSIYLKTTPLTQDANQNRIDLGNSAKQARSQLETVGFDKRRLAALGEHFDDLASDDEFWSHQANGLAILATPDLIRTYRMANNISPTVQVSDRFHLKPLLRAITFPHSAFALALAENSVRLVEVFADLPPRVVKVDGLPKSAASAAGKSSLKDRAAVRRIQGSEGKNVRLKQYARHVDSAIRAVLAGRETPLILASTGRLANIFHSISSYSHLVQDRIENSADQLTDADLANAAVPILDSYYKQELSQILGRYEARTSQDRATSDLDKVARAATFGAIEALLVDIDSVIPGTVDEDSGEVTLAGGEDANSYGIIDEITGRALESDARVLGVRKSDLPGDADLAAILRYPL